MTRAKRELLVIDVKPEKEVLWETYFGIGLGVTRIDGKTLIILPFIVIFIA